MNRGITHPLKEGFFADLKVAAVKSWYRGYHRKYHHKMNFTEAVAHYQDFRELYLYYYYYFYHFCPSIIQQHRYYFSEEQRGFGEDAFHAMWWTLLSEFRPIKCLEIGVYRGQTLSLWALISKLENIPSLVSGISPLTPVGDSVSEYLKNIDYYNDIQTNFAHFELAPPKILKAYSTDPSAADYIKGTRWDLIYLDGSHDFDIVLADYQLCREQLTPGGLLVFDDSTLFTDNQSVCFAFKGHPGPSEVCRDYAKKEMKFICSVGHISIFQGV